jgi:hypothetical protein
MNFFYFFDYNIRKKKRRWVVEQFTIHQTLPSILAKILFMLRIFLRIQKIGKQKCKKYLIKTSKKKNFKVNNRSKF